MAPSCGRLSAPVNRMAARSARPYHHRVSDNPYLARLHGERAKLVAQLEPLERDRLVRRDAGQTETQIHFIHRQLGDLDVSIRSEERRRDFWARPVEQSRNM